MDLIRMWFSPEYISQASEPKAEKTLSCNGCPMKDINCAGCVNQEK